VTVSSELVEITDRERLERVDILLCLLFKGFINHPLATTMIPPDEVKAIKAILREE
jgi:hypothetical protein